MGIDLVNIKRTQIHLNSATSHQLTFESLDFTVKNKIYYLQGSPAGSYIGLFSSLSVWFWVKCSLSFSIFIICIVYVNTNSLATLDESILRYYCNFFILPEYVALGSIKSSYIPLLLTNLTSLAQFKFFCDFLLLITIFHTQYSTRLVRTFIVTS